MILTDIEKFTELVPTAEGSELKKLIPFLEESEQWIRENLLGDGLYALIAGLDETGEMKRHAQTAICLKAYETAIPFVDLVQAENGFAVVSNSAQAPASKERVERLLRFVARRLTAELDSIVLQIRAGAGFLPAWKASPAFDFRTETVFLTVAELRNFSGNREADYLDLESAHPQILGFQTEIAGHVSRNCLTRLLEKRGGGELSRREEKAFRIIQTVVGLKMQDLPCHPLTENLVNYMVALPEEFPDHINSPEYRLKISPKYENRKEHSTFFFG